jgi:hypothetical protein
MRGGFVDADAHDGGAERAEKTSPDASSSSVSFRWTTRGRARVASAVVVAPPVALEARGSVARPRRVERRDGSSHRPDATPTGSDVVIGDAAGPIRGDARDLVGTVRPCAPRNACPARAQPRVVVETFIRQVIMALLREEEVVAQNVAISLFVATASQKKRVLEKKSIGASRARPRRCALLPRLVAAVGAAAGTAGTACFVHVSIKSFVSSRLVRLASSLSL